MPPILKYNIHLFAVFSLITYFTIGSHFYLPEFLRPLLFIVMIFASIFLVMMGETFKKGLPEKGVNLSRLSWTIIYVLVVLLGSYVFGVLPGYTLQAFLPLASIYLLLLILKISRNKLRTNQPA
ncbi:hypothetical protein FZC84_10780 [Rossellomorea vietnamensis]|uniref:Uncharacterized protein n=1 Tax=Rossellomorea vietnamensis TaxID=218284 RepID=A0A5D4MC67_9BACI|nr:MULTISPECIES: hypothetical protein [Bacillaceae]TYR99236.1 hypothetical protein FZC84_10780 [Rossellomorea vietnamensis]